VAHAILLNDFVGSFGLPFLLWSQSASLFFFFTLTLALVGGSCGRMFRSAMGSTVRPFFFFVCAGHVCILFLFDRMRFSHCL